MNFKSHSKVEMRK